jgi:hypothetical protein
MRVAVKSLICCVVLLSSCAYPVSGVVQGGENSALSFASLPPQAVVSVNGQVVGSALDYAGKVLTVAPGTHHVVVTVGGTVMVDRNIYVGRQSTVSVAAQ